MDRPPRPDFDWLRIAQGELPLGELQRIDDAASRATDEQGGTAGDALAHPGMAQDLTPPGLRAAWGKITGVYGGEGTPKPLYTFSAVLHDANAAVDVEDGVTGVALEVNGSLAVPTDAVCLFWPSEDSLDGASGEKWRFIYISDYGDQTVNYFETVINYLDVTINYTDVTVNVQNLVSVVAENYTWWVTGGGFVVFDAPFTVCGWLFYCYYTYAVGASQLDDWAVPSTQEKVVVRLTASGDFAITGMVPASTLASLSGVPSQADGDDWAGPDNVFASDNVYATYALARNATSDSLSAQGFGLDVPGNATILGIAVGVERSKTGTGVLSDTEFALLKAGVPVGTHRHSAADWPGADATLTVGGATDLWGTTWTPAEVNDPEFGVELKATENNTAAVTLRVDAVTLSVTYRITDGGQFVVLSNTSASDMTLTHESAASTAAYRFLLEDGGDKTVGPDGNAPCWYDPASLRWRVWRQPDASGGGGGTSLTNDSSYLLGTYTLTSLMTDTGLSVSLPDAGRYQLTYVVEVVIGGGAFSGATAGCQLIDHTLMVLVPNSDFGILEAQISDSEHVTSTVVVYYDVSGPTQIRLQAAITTFDGSGAIARANLLSLKIA